jgi:ketosteroid isomerase-like protein
MRTFRKTYLIATALAVALLVSAQTKVAPAKDDDVRAVERERVRAVVAADTAALGRLLGNDLTYTHSTAWVETKAQFLESLRSGALKYEKMDHRDVQARVYGAAAVLIGLSDVRVHSPRAGQVEMQIRFTAVYVNRDGRWQMVAWQSTRVPQP